MSRITEAHLRAIYDSRGHPTVEARLATDAGVVATAGAPSGASTSTHEVVAFPTGGVPAALAVFERSVRAKIVGASVDDQAAIDRALHEVDGTPDFSRIGGNTATAVSVATAIASAFERKVPLWKRLLRPGLVGPRFPAICGNCLNGGKHAWGGPDIQEFIAYSTAPDPADSIRAALEVHHRLGAKLHARFPTIALGRGDEGGWVAPLGNVEALELLVATCAEVRDALHLPVHPGIDLAATEFFRDGQYVYKEQTLSPEGQLGFVTSLVDRYELKFVEDPFEDNDYNHVAAFTRAVGGKVTVVGDDLYATSLARVREGVERRATNAVLIKVNQVGTLTDTLATVDYVRAQGLANVSSHRSGEVPDAWLAHLAVAFGSLGLKCGLLGGERVAKLNELLRIGAPAGS